jgi:FlaA1/EpsC-like NDP-sugar epimerase
MNRSERDDKILVTGATGTIGSEVVKQLASYNNNAIRAAVHSQNKVDNSNNTIPLKLLILITINQTLLQMLSSI